MNKKLAFGLSLAAATALLISGCASDSSKRSGTASSSDALPTPATTPPGAPAPASVARASAPAPAIKEEIHNPSTPAATAPAAAPVATEKYTVKSGDSLWKIARERKTSVAKLKELNHLTGDAIRAGDELEVPALTQ